MLLQMNSNSLVFKQKQKQTNKYLYEYIFQLQDLVFFVLYNRHQNYLYVCVYIHMVFITEGFFEVAIECWPEWDLNPQPLNSFQTL